MGEARRKSKQGLSPRKTAQISNEDRIVSWLPITQKQRIDFIDLTIRGAWIGIIALVIIWVTVRFIGPALGWWIPADMH